MSTLLDSADFECFPEFGTTPLPGYGMVWFGTGSPINLRQIFVEWMKKMEYCDDELGGGAQGIYKGFLEGAIWYSVNVCGVSP